MLEVWVVTRTEGLDLPSSSSTLGESPANLAGSGPIIFTSWGTWEGWRSYLNLQEGLGRVKDSHVGMPLLTSRLAMVQNLARAFMHRNTCSSEGLPCDGRSNLTAKL